MSSSSTLLRGWLDYLRDAVDKGQVWIATHALEAAEVAGLSATLVFERDEDRKVSEVAPLGDRPALRTLAGTLGTPAFSIARSRFLLIEGERPGRERERFARLLESPPTDRFVESGGGSEVLRRLDSLRALASEEEQLQVGGFIDRDFKSDGEADELEGEHDVCVLPVHEVENFFLHPGAAEALAVQAGQEAGAAAGLLQAAADELTGQWVWERTLHETGWDAEPLGPAKGKIYTLAWADLSDERVEAAVAAMPSLDEPERLRRRAALKHSRAEYERLRDDPDQLWRQCLGKETMKRLAGRLGLDGAEAIEVRVEQLWSDDQVERPAEAGVMKTYIEEIEVLT